MRRSVDKKVGLTFGIATIVLALALPLPAQAELWQGARVVGRKKMRLGLIGQIYAPSANYATAVMGLGQFVYGISDRWQIEPRLGFGMIDFYLGVFGKYLIYEQTREDGSPGIFALSTLFGFHRQVSYNLSLAVIAGLKLGPVDLYLAPEIRVAVTTASPSFGMTSGIQVNIVDRIAAFLEGTIGVANSWSTVSLGLRIAIGDP